MERTPLAWGVKERHVPKAAAPQVCISRFRNTSLISILKFFVFSFQLSLMASFSAGWAALDFSNRVFSPTQALSDHNHIAALQQKSFSSIRLLQPPSPALCRCLNCFLPINLRIFYFQKRSRDRNSLGRSATL